MHIDISNEAITLSFVGFLFAFAGINIYSIFNTNIEAEKDRLNTLADSFESRLELSSRLMETPNNMMMTYQLTMYVASTEAFQMSLYGWMDEITQNLCSIRDIIQTLKDNKQEKLFEHSREELSKLAEGMSIILSQHKKKVVYSNYFDKVPTEADHYKERMEELLKFVDDLKYYEYDSSENNTKTKKTFLEKIKSMIDCLFGEKD